MDTKRRKIEQLLNAAKVLEGSGPQMLLVLNGAGRGHFKYMGKVYPNSEAERISEESGMDIIEIEWVPAAYSNVTVDD